MGAERVILHSQTTSGLEMVERYPFVQLLIDFANWTTLVCLNKIVNSSKWLAIFFTGVFIAMCACLVYFYVTCTLKFFTFPSSFELSTAIEPMDFPCFSFCNENPMKRSVVDSKPVYADISRLLRQYELIEANQTTVDDFYLTMKTDSRRQRLHRAQVMLRLLMAKLSTSDRIAASYQFTELVTECTFDGVTCTSADFTPFLHPEYGVCFTFNKNRTITRAVQKEGLRMLFTVKQDSPTEGVSDFLPTTESATMLVWGVVHDSGEFADFSNDGFKMGVGSRVFVGLSKTTYSRLDKPYGNCSHDATENYGDFNYTYQTCQHGCLQRLAMEKCGCADPLYKKAENETHCSAATDMLCLVTLTHEIAAANSEGGRKLCWCKPACLDSFYVESVTSGGFPSEKYKVAAGTVDQRESLLISQGGGKKGGKEEESDYDNPSETCRYKGPPDSAHEVASKTDYCKDKFKQVYTDPNLIAVRGYPCTSTKPCATCVIFSKPPTYKTFICNYPSCPEKQKTGYLKEISCPGFFLNFDFIPVGAGVPNISKWSEGASPSEITCKSDHNDCPTNSACETIPISSNFSKLIGTDVHLAQEFLATLESTTTACEFADLALKAAKRFYDHHATTRKPSQSLTTTSRPMIDMNGLGSCEYANRNFDTSEECIRWYRRNGVMMHLHFKTIEEYTYTQGATYPFISLLSDYAGHAGLWLGMSVVTLVEVIGLCILCIAWPCCGKRMKPPKKNYPIELDDLDTTRSV